MAINEFAYKTEFFSFKFDISLDQIIKTVDEINSAYFNNSNLEISFSSLEESFIKLTVKEFIELYNTFFPNINMISFNIHKDVTSFSINFQYRNHSVGANGNFSIYAGSIENNRAIEKIIRENLPLESPKQIALETEIVVSPIFNARNFKIKEKYCFVLMPFTLKWSNRVYKHLRGIVNNLGYNCERADNLFGKNILEDIWSAINEAEIIIADVTAKNPNVFYEIGIAHTLGKKVILITQSSADIPFDFKGYRHVIYEDNVDGFKILEDTIPKYFKS